MKAIIKQNYVKIFYLIKNANLEIIVSLLMGEKNFEIKKKIILYIKLNCASNFLKQIFVLMVIDANIYTALCIIKKFSMILLIIFSNKIVF